MRDILLVLFFAAWVVPMLKHPWIGVIMWVWLSVMNPHRLSYGFSYSLPFAAACAAITFIGILSTKDERRLPTPAPVVLLAVFTLWMCITAVLAIHSSDDNYALWSRIMKIMLMNFVALLVIHDRKQIQWIIYAIVVSLAYYGIKGGLFTIASGGHYIVWGPEGSFINGNNELALALVAAIPLMRWVQLQLTKKWQRHGMTATIMLCTISALGSQSRGALLAIAAMLAALWWKSRSKLATGLLLVIMGVVGLSLMPQEWWDRMNTIKTYDEDASAMGRINAWWMTFNLARDHLFGGGFDIYQADTFARYAPNPTDIHAAHSIYFQVLGEHGFLGLFLFLAIGATTWALAGRTRNMVKKVPEFAWAATLMDAVKVSMIGFGTGGAFLSLAYYDTPYYLIVVVVAVHELVKRSPVVKEALARRDDWRVGQFGSRPRNPLDDVDEVPAPSLRPAPTGFGRPRDRVGAAKSFDQSGGVPARDPLRQAR